MFRIGFGSDVHRLVEGTPLAIGGVTIASDLGAEGHSDADVLLHALTDALFGALALGDIGTHFPNSDPQWKNAESSIFLAKAVELAKEKGWQVVNVDSTVSLEIPKLRPHIDAIREKVAGLVGIDIDRISVKAKTNEGLGAVGERRAIRAEAVVLLTRA